MNQIYTAQEMANYIVQKCIDNGHRINNCELQQRLWFLQIDHMARYDGDKLILDDFQAWRFGPVIPDVYYHFCGYGCMPISHVFGARHLEPEDADYVDGMIKALQNHPFYDLIEACCPVGGAWSQTYKGGEGEKEIISYSRMRQEAAHWGA